MREAALQPLLQDPRIWRPGQRGTAPRRPALSTGYAALDAALPDGGWPIGSVTEFFHDQPAIGELQLLLPTLAALSQRQQWLALVGPPYIPYAPGLAYAGVDLSRVLLIHPRAQEDHLWATEQALQSGTCGAVVAWPGQRLDPAALRRLQLAAETGDSWAALFRPQQAARNPSPAAVRIALEAEPEGRIQLEILKCRGGRATHLQLNPWQRGMENPAVAPLGERAARDSTAARTPSPNGQNNPSRKNPDRPSEAAVAEPRTTYPRQRREHPRKRRPSDAQLTLPL